MISGFLRDFRVLIQSSVFAGDPQLTRLLLGMGLRIFSMHPSQILEVKSKVLKANVGELTPNVRRMLRLDEPGKLREALEKINA